MTQRVCLRAALSLAILIILRSGATQAVAGTQSGVMQAFTSAFDGRWKIRETGAVPNSATKSISEGDEVWSFEPGGVPFVEHYHSKGPKGDAFDVGYFWWNSVTNTIDGSFCMASSEQGCTPFHVQWENNRAVMDGEYLSKGKVLKWREVFTFSGNDAFTQVLDVGEAGTELKPVATISAERRKQ